MTTRMTPEECAACMKALQPKIDNYAELLVRDGAAVQPGQELVVQAPVEAREFARRVVAAAYAAGAGRVTVIWADDEITRMEYEALPVERFESSVASLMRWASPPDSVVADCPRAM